MVDELFVPSAKQTSVLYSRLSDFYIPSCFSTLTLTHMYECVCSISYDDDAIDDAILSEVRTYSAKIQQADTVLQLTANTDWQKYRCK